MGVTWRGSVGRSMRAYRATKKVWEKMVLSGLWWWLHGCIHLSKLIKIHTVNTCSLSHVNYSSKKLFKKKSTQIHGSLPLLHLVWISRVNLVEGCWLNSLEGQNKVSGPAEQHAQLWVGVLKRKTRTFK